MGYLFKVLRSGLYKPAGTVEIPFLGAKVGELASWSLVRRGDTGPEAGLYDLHAAFSFVSDALWNDPEYDKVIFVSLSPQKRFRLEQAEGHRTIRTGRNLVVEGVTIHVA